jgi:alkylmercury lyase
MATIVACNKTPSTQTGYNEQTKKNEVMKDLKTEAITGGIKIIKENGFDEQPVLLRLLSKGESVSIVELAKESGSTEERIREVLSGLSGVEYDDNGHIIGYGMTLKPTPHRFDFNGKTAYGWCASDALSFPFLLEQSGIVTSICPFTGKEIRIKVTPDSVLSVDPPEAVVTSVRPMEQVDDVRSEVCGVGLFLSSPDLASEWLKAHPEGFVHTIQEDFEVHKQVFKEVGWIN